MQIPRSLLVGAAILACAAPQAVARPSVDPAGARPHEVRPSTPATIVTHKEQLGTEQYLASRGRSAPAAPLVDRTDAEGFPAGLVALVVLAIPGALGLAMIARPVRTYVAHRRAHARLT